MKVAFVNQPMRPMAVPPTADSIGVVIYHVARCLVRSCEAIVYARRGHLQPRIEYEEGVQYRRVPSARDHRPYRLLERFSGLFKRPYLSSSYDRNYYYLDYILQVANDLRAQKCDVVHIHNFSQFVPIIRALNPKVKIVLQMHCEWLTEGDRATIERRLGKVDLILGCSEYITDKIRRRFPQFAARCRTVFNGVDAEELGRECGDTPARKDGAKRLLFVGRVSPEKGVHVLLDAFRIVVNQHPQARLEIVGPQKQLPLKSLLSLSDDERIAELVSFYDENACPIYLPHLHQQLETLGIADRVTFSGFVPHEVKINYYREADVFVNSSFSDAFPLPVPEAMASGLPIVATQVGGIPEAVVNGETGLLVEAGDASALAEATLRLLVNENLREAMGKAGRRRALELFSWDHITDDLLRHYKGVHD